MKSILKALEALHGARPETTMWSVHIFSDGSGALLDSSHETVPDTLFLRGSSEKKIVNIILAQITK